MSDPKLGMKYEDVRQRVKRIASSDVKNPQLARNLTNSLLNQAERADRGARRELESELRHYCK